MRRVAGSGYWLGIGSNLAPERNVADALQALLLEFETFYCSRIVYTEPEAVASRHCFINAVLFIPTSMPMADLKARCNRIETELGRDREHPQRKLRDRPADLDILHFCPDIACCDGMTIKENYLRPLADELHAYLQGRVYCADSISRHLKPAYIYAGNMLLGQTPATIDRDDGAGLIRVF